MLPVAVSKKGVRLAQKMQVGPYVPVGIQLLKDEVGPTSGPTWRLSHLSGNRGVVGLDIVVDLDGSHGR